MLPHRYSMCEMKSQFFFAFIHWPMSLMDVHSYSRCALRLTFVDCLFWSGPLGFLLLYASFAHNSFSHLFLLGRF